MNIRKGRERVNFKFVSVLCNAELQPSDLFGHTSLPAEVYLTLLSVIYPAEIHSGYVFSFLSLRSQNFTHLHLVQSQATGCLARRPHIYPQLLQLFYLVKLTVVMEGGW